MDTTKKAPKLLSRDSILGLNDRVYEVFEVPEWGGSVPILSLDAWEQSQYEQSLMSAEVDGKGNVSIQPRMEGTSIRLCAMGIRGEDGKPWFSETELRTKSAGAIKRIANRIRTISGMDAEAKEEAEGN